ncbi:hypothetical protein FB451DRAFT_1556037 [Mycena latifolia]|nr:hypothetical protein FB451DRAFT_1556037 [Mycena latifolia]
MQRTNVVTSLVSGIQDISAFLPIIGTEQCEKHVGEALKGGFLYAAATPLSIFGCLGIVKASAAILVASISPRFAQMLADSGFKLVGTVAAMIGKEPTSKGSDANENEDGVQTDGVPQYIASKKFKELLKERHIDKSQLELGFDYYSWNWWLCISTGLFACFSITPYIRIIMDYNTRSEGFPAWAPPLMRIVGSAISVVIAQMIIQIQMERILQMPTTVRSSSSTSDFGPIPLLHADDIEMGNITAASNSYQQQPMRHGRNFSQAMTVSSQESSESLVAHEDDSTNQRAVPASPNHVTPLPNDVPQRIRLAFLQALLFIGIGSTAVGYLGCFTVVQNSRPVDTYIWLGVEGALALVRVYIWGLNPSWDEKTGLRLDLRLPGDIERAPPITTGQDFETRILNQQNLSVGVMDSDFTDYIFPYSQLPDADSQVIMKPDPFVVLTEKQFLEYISPYTGPMEGLTDPDNHVVIYYTLVGCRPDDFKEAKILLTTVLDLESRSTFVLTHHCPSKNPSAISLDITTIYSATFAIMQDSGIMTVKCGNILYGTHEFRKRFAAIDKHSRVIADRIGGIDRVIRLRVSWCLDSPTPELEEPGEAPQSPLTHLDKECLRMQRLAYQWRQDFDTELDLHMLECMAYVLDLKLPPGNRWFAELAIALERLLDYECILFEKNLLAKTTPGGMTNHIFYEYARRLDVSVASEPRAEALAKRIAQYSEMMDSAGISASESNLFPVNILSQLSVAKDIDDETWKRSQARLQTTLLHYRPAAVVTDIWKLEAQQMETRCRTWEMSPTLLNPDLAQAVFGAYPSARCANDPELFGIMAARRCAVFDFAWDDSNSLPPVFPPQMAAVPGVSLLRCPEEWFSQLTKLAQRNNILAIELPDFTTLGKDLGRWGETVSIQNGDIISCLGFSAGFQALGTCMNFTDPDIDARAAGFLLVRITEKRTIRVTFLHRQWKELGSTRISLSRKTTVLGTIELLHSDDFKRDSFVVELPQAGVHRLDIKVDTPPFAITKSVYDLRKVWVTPVQEEDPGRSSRSMEP